MYDVIQSFYLFRYVLKVLMTDNQILSAQFLVLLMLNNYAARLYCFMNIN